MEEPRWTICLKLMSLNSFICVVLLYSDWRLCFQLEINYLWYDLLCLRISRISCFPYTEHHFFSLSLSLSLYIFSHCFKLCFILWSFLCKQFLETLSRPLTGSLRTAICQTIQSQNTMSTSSSRYATRALSFFELYILLFKWRNTLLRFSLCCFLVYDLLCWDK